MSNRIIVALLLVTLFSNNSHGQNAGQGKAQPVSADLLAVFEKTKSVTTEDDVTAVARACAKVIPDQKRSDADRDYAESLLAWALNRRGEMRSSKAAELVTQGKLAEADELDRKAAEDYKTAIEYAPSNWRNHHNYAIALAMKGQYPKAIEEFNTVLKLKSDYPNAYFNRGELYLEIGRFEEAKSDYSRAIELAPNDPQFYNSRGHCYFALEKHDEAVADYRKAAELGSDSAVYQTDLADALQSLGNWEEAAKLYRQAVATNGKYARAYQNAAWLMTTCPDDRFRNVELGLSAAKKAVELEGKATAHGLDTLAAAQAAAGKHEEAIKLQRRAIQLATDSEQSELKDRLALYEKGLSYLQPDRVENIATADSSSVQTAAGSQVIRK